MDRFLARRGISPVTLSACQLAAASVLLAITLGILVLGEHITLVIIAGIAPILAGVTLTRETGRPRRAAPGG
jgi:drug/metabolite transporter (DMT)-like permease